MSNSTQNVVTANDYSPVVNVLNWFLIATAGISVLARSGFKLFQSDFKTDDYVTWAALAFAIGSCITTSLATRDGFGQSESMLSEDQVASIQKDLYAGELLVVTSLVASKLSIHVLLRSFIMTAFHKAANYVMMAATGLWGLSLLFVFAFQCSLPTPWLMMTSPKCIDRSVFLMWFSVSNIMLEVALLALLFAVVAAVQIPWKKRLLVFLCFVPRVVVIGASIAYIVVLGQLPASFENATLDWWPLVLTAQFLQDLSIITSCTPYLKPFFVSMQSGMIRSDDLRRRGQSGIYGYAGTGSQRSWKDFSGRRAWAGSSSNRASRVSTGRKEWRDSNRIQVQTEFEIINER